ncbi:MAG: hypothetical protein JWO11_4491 [Nocardioides sp.]|nr:hypothetical protein [Nocardioides sp.]
MMDDRRQQLNPAGVAAIPVVTSSTPPEPPPPPSGARPGTGRVRIATGGLVSTTAVVQVDGHDLAHCTRSFRLEAGVREATRLTLDVVATKVAEFDGEAIVGFNRDFEALLVGLGWTPPADEMGG